MRAGAEYKDKDRLGLEADELALFVCRRPDVEFAMVINGDYS